MGIITDANNSYGIVPGLVYSFPVQCNNGSWSIVKGELCKLLETSKLGCCKHCSIMSICQPTMVTHLGQLCSQSTTNTACCLLLCHVFAGLPIEPWAWARMKLSEADLLEERALALQVLAAAAAVELKPVVGMEAGSGNTWFRRRARRRCSSNSSRC
jgi:hypothetical protein